MSKAYSTFADAARATLAGLQAKIPFAMWMIVRYDGEQCVVLHRRDRSYGVKEGAPLLWGDLLCSRMLHGDGPRFAPDVLEVPAYRDAPLRDNLPIRAYIGTALYRRSGELFGTLCAIDPKPQSHTILLHEPLLDLTASLLSTVYDLHQELDTVPVEPSSQETTA